MTPTTFHSYAQRSRDLSDKAHVTAAIKTILHAVLDHDYGGSIKRSCRGLAIVIAFTYAVGYALGAWVHQCNQQLSALVVRKPSIGDPQPTLPCIEAPQAATVNRTTRSKLPIPPAKPTRRRRAKGSSRTKAPANS